MVKKVENKGTDIHLLDCYKVMLKKCKTKQVINQAILCLKMYIDS